MKKLTNFLFSTKLMSVVVLLFAVAMAVATFVENDYGTQAAKALIYNSWWFEVLMYLLTINFIGNIFRYRLYRKEKWPVLLFHLAFIITLLGAFITRYFGFEGLMPIREGEVSNTIYSDNMFVQVRVNGDKEPRAYDKKVLFGALNNNDFTINGDYFGKRFSVSYKDYIPNIKTAFTPDKTGDTFLHVTISTAGGRKDLYLKDKSITKYAGQLLSYNKPVEGAINFTGNQDTLFIQSPEDGQYTELKTMKNFQVVKDSIAPLKILHLYKLQKVGIVVSEPPVKGNLQQVSAPKSEQKKYPFDALYLTVSSGDESKEIVVQGAKNEVTEPVTLSLNGMNFLVSYGAKKIYTPFSIKLQDFELLRYPGSRSPSSYSSKVTVMDKNKTFDYHIYMNHVLDYKGYRFFQASYDKDEKGTILSVNHDYWGTLITYLGYLLMGIGMFFSLFVGKTRFKKLSSKLSKLSKSNVILLLIALGISSSSIAQNNPELLKNVVKKEHADKFGKLLIQDHQGRIKPVNTYALEALRKVYKKDEYHGLTAEQVLLSTQLFPEKWYHENTIAIVYPLALGTKIMTDLKVKNKHTSMANFFLDNASYYLQDKVDEAFQKKNTERNATDKEIINLDERANIWWNLLNGKLLKIYPKRGDANNKWYTGLDEKAFQQQDTMLLKMHQMYLSSLKNAVQTGDYKQADEFLGYIATYQKDVAKDLIPPAKKIDLEIQYNKWNIFKKLMFYYMIIGFIFLILAFLDLFKPNSRLINILLKVFSVLTIIGMVFHVIGMGVRWYVSGHEPWSNGYEAVVFVAFVTILAGLLFSKNKSKFTIASTVIFASFLLGIAHGSMMSPEMTNLVPVLKSYWLMIHVAVITSSYGFLGLGSLLGFVVLLLYILRTPDNAERFNDTIDELTYINESALTVGLYTLTIGTFLGGVWASESWGRYWSWDPKEVWSLISMMVYVFVLHMRLVPGLRSKFTFNLVSLFSIATLIMTFFGVNFYLSGMHSYAAGDPVPIPVWIYYAIAFFVLFSIISYLRYKKYEDQH